MIDLEYPSVRGGGEVTKVLFCYENTTLSHIAMQEIRIIELHYKEPTHKHVGLVPALTERGGDC